MDFTDFSDVDWEFLESVVAVGLEAPDIDEDGAIEVDSLIASRVGATHYSEEDAELLRDAFDIGWNVATENGTNELAERFSHVLAAIVPPSKAEPASRA